MYLARVLNDIFDVYPYLIVMGVLEENYEWLMDYQRRTNEFIVSDWGCGLQRYKSMGWNNKGLIIVNPEQKKAYMLVYPNGEIAGFTIDDLDLESIEKTGYAHEAKKLKVDYCLDIERFQDGIAKVYWMLHPDGSYFADEGGFGRTDDEEVYIYAFVDTECRVVRKFQLEE